MYPYPMLSVGGALAIFGLSVARAFAQSALPECVHNAATPSQAVVVGFPGEKVPVFAAHPFTCGALPGSACRPLAIISSGTAIAAATDCEGWTLVQDAQRTPSVRGWMATRRILVAAPDATDGLRPLPVATPHLPPPPISSTTSTARLRLCAVVRADLNARNRIIEWPSKRVPASSLPPGVATALADAEPNTISVWSVQLPGRAIKLVKYRDADHRDDIVTLWSSDFSHEITTLRNGDNNLRERLVDIAGVPIFTEKKADTGSVDVFRITAGLTMRPICTLEVAHYEGPEEVESAAQPEVCEAASKGTVDNVLLSDIVPYSLTSEELSASAQASDPFPDTFDIVAVGQADLDNDGDIDRVGWAEVDSINGPRESYFEWPVILAADGTLRPRTPLNLIALQHSGKDSSGRLFGFLGSTYFEFHWRANSQDHVHEIWKFTSSDAKRVCMFSSHQSQRYEISKTSR